MNYLDIIVTTTERSFNYLMSAIQHPFKEGSFIVNGFYYLILVSLLIWVLEIALPWRKKQALIRKDFWLDSFYMFFNFYFFNVLGFAVIVKLTYMTFTDFLGLFGYTKGVLFDLSGSHWLLQVLLYFLLVDFIQWVVHVLLHRVPFLWKFHKVHHSVKEMGFAAHLRYHFVENMIYRPAKYVIVSLLFGFRIENIFIIHYLTVLIGHLNHANVGWDYGPLKYIFNNPKMHIWHHVKELPESHPNGVNFGISLSVWDYLFKTNYIPSSGRDIELGFEGDEKYPQGFLGQVIEPFKRPKK